MSFQDTSLAFQTGGWTTAQAVTVTADGSQVVDLTGAGSGNAPAMINGFPATNTAIGYDIGAGDGLAIPYLYSTVTVTGTTTNTLTISLSAAPDNGSYGQGTYTQLYASKAIAANTLIKGDYLIVPVPPTLFQWPSESLPRFYKITYTCSGSLTISLLSGIMLNPPSSLLLPQYNNNFTVV